MDDYLAKAISTKKIEIVVVVDDEMAFDPAQWRWLEDRARRELSNLSPIETFVRARLKEGK